MKTIDAIRGVLGGQPVMLSAAGFAASAVRAHGRINLPTPWSAITNDGAGGGEDPSYPDRIRKCQMEVLGCPVERRRTGDGREVVVVRVEGSLAFDATLAWWWGLWTPAVCAILADLAEEAERGVSVAPVVLAFNCYGGQHMGLSDLLAGMRRLKAARPVISLVHEQMYSLAYEFGCVADRVVATRTAYLGSIGSRNTITSVARMNDEAGIDVATQASGKWKTAGDPDKPLSQEDVKYFASFVDKAAGEFFSIVSEARGLSVEAIRGMEAGWFGAEDAMANGLVDLVIDDVDAFLEETAAAPSGAGAGAGGAGRPGAEPVTRGRTLNMAATINTVEDLRAAHGPLVQSIENAAMAKGVEQGKAAATPQPATLDELRAKFAGPENAAFREDCLGKKLTLVDAMAARTVALESENAELKKKLDEKTGVLAAIGKGAEASDAKVPGDPAKGGAGGAGGGGELIVDGKKLEGPAAAFYADVRSRVAGGSKVGDALQAAQKKDRDGHAAYVKAGSPGLADLKPPKKSPSGG